MDKKRILIFTVNAWSNVGGTYTFSSLFRDYGSQYLANICIRDQSPDSKLCSRYFRISEQKILGRYFNPFIKTGTEIKIGEINKSDNTNRKPHAGESRRNFFLLLMREIMWKLGFWKSRELKEFLDDFSPQIIVYAMEGYVHLNRIVRYSIKRTGARAIGYFWDDNFTYKQYTGFWFKILRFFQKRELKKCVKITDGFWAISPKTKKEADQVFGIDCVLITKPIYEFKKLSISNVRQPYKIMYTGNLLIGRLNTLTALIDILDTINVEAIYFELEVYTQTNIGEKCIERLSRPWCKFFYNIPQSVISDKQATSDILVLLEDIYGGNRKVARLSFSTKITDYFAAGKCILAIGDEDIASIEYLKSEDSAIIASNKEEIFQKLTDIMKNPKLITDFQKKAFECGVRNHSANIIKKRIDETIEKVSRKEK